MPRLVSLAAFLMLSSLSSASPFLVAHRGASGDAPENTIPAFELAWKQGADAIEGDFHLTRDGKIVCVHDADTKATTGQEVPVHERTLAELQDFDVGAWKGKKFAGTRMPTFADVCATVPDGKKFYIEIKCGPEVVPVLLDEIREAGLEAEQIVVIAFNAEVIRTVKAARPQWVANWLYAFDRKKDDDPERQLPEVLRVLKDVKADALASNSHHGITKAHLDRLAAAGFAHHVWTVNDAETARRFLDMGTKSVTTDFPGRLRKELAAE